MEFEERVELVMRAPIAALTFVQAIMRNVGPDRLADPAIASLLAYEAHASLTPWTGEHRWRVAEAVAAVRPLRSVVAEVLADARNTWWWSDLDRERQLWVSDVDLEPADLVPVEGSLSSWGHYAQKLAWDSCIVTSTELAVPADDEIRSGLHASLAGVPATDWIPDFPVRQARLGIADTARVWEIHQPGDWHRLCVDYGDLDSYPGPDSDLLEVGIDRGLAPTWSAVASDWDGTHLSFFGFLTSVYQPVAADDLTTTLWAWETERTQWLRNVFTRRMDLAPITVAPKDRQEF